MIHLDNHIVKRTKKSVELEPENCFRLYWDLETTSRSRSRIVSIGYSSEDDTVAGELLIYPKVMIDECASEVHGYTLETLLKHGAKSCKEQLQKFMDMILKIGKPVVMVAHNGKCFDTNVLRHELEINNIQLAENIVGFVDTLHWLKYYCKYKIANIDHLLITLLNKNARDLHGAKEDSICLKDIVLHVLQLRNEKRLAYFESRDEFMVRTSKWLEEQEVFKDIQEEVIFFLESICEHTSIEETPSGRICTHCNIVLV